MDCEYRFKVPSELATLSRGLTKEILREVTELRLQPDKQSIINFAAQYFAHKEATQSAPIIESKEEAVKLD